MATGCALFAQHAAALALVLLRADAAGDGGQRVVFAHLGRRGQIVARVDQGHDLFDLDAHRAIDYAAGLGAGDAARGLCHGVGRACSPRFTSSKLRLRALRRRAPAWACAESSCAPLSGSGIRCSQACCPASCAPISASQRARNLPLLSVRPSCAQFGQFFLLVLLKVLQRLAFLVAVHGVALHQDFEVRPARRRTPAHPRRRTCSCCPAARGSRRTCRCRPP